MIIGGPEYAMVEASHRSRHHPVILALDVLEGEVESGAVREEHHDGVRTKLDILDRFAVHGSHGSILHRLTQMYNIIIP